MLSVKPETTVKIKVGIWGFIGGALVTMIIGFNWGGWETASATQKLNEAAVSKSQAAICVAQFMEGSGYKEKLAELQKLENWSRSEFITKGGWDKMPGQKEAGFGVSQACADGLQTLLSMK
jgi:hypothetical protein